MFHLPHRSTQTSNLFRNSFSIIYNNSSPWEVSGLGSKQAECQPDLRKASRTIRGLDVRTWSLWYGAIIWRHINKQEAKPEMLQSRGKEKKKTNLSLGGAGEARPQFSTTESTSHRPCLSEVPYWWQLKCPPQRKPGASVCGLWNAQKINWGGVGIPAKII